MASKSDILQTYRRMLKLVNRMPKEKAKETRIQIAKEFRRNANESDPNAVKKLVEKAQSSIGYIKMVTPRVRSDNAGVTRIVVDHSHGIKKTQVHSNWTGSNMDPEQVARHYSSLKRAGYRKGNADVNSGGF